MRELLHGIRVGAVIRRLKEAWGLNLLCLKCPHGVPAQECDEHQRDIPFWYSNNGVPLWEGFQGLGNGISLGDLTDILSGASKALQVAQTLYLLRHDWKLVVEVECRNPILPPSNGNLGVYGGKYADRP